MKDLEIETKARRSIKNKLKNKGIINSMKDYLKQYLERESLPFHRFQSWKHCYETFQNSQDSNTLAIHLSMYLASWGMYRGSTFSLFRSYKIHKLAVERIISFPNRIELQDCNENYEQKLGLVAELASQLYNDYTIELEKSKEQYKNSYKEYYCDGFFPQMIGERSITMTFITKILLGALGCSPAYDSLFSNGIKLHNEIFCNNTSTIYDISDNVAFNKEKLMKSLNSIISSEIFRELKNYHNFPEYHHYPIMKLVDIYFWSLGEDLELCYKNIKLSYRS